MACYKGYQSIWGSSTRHQGKTIARLVKPTWCATHEKFKSFQVEHLSLQHNADADVLTVSATFLALPPDASEEIGIFIKDLLRHKSPSENVFSWSMVKL